MKTCQNCIHLIYPTKFGYACKKIGRWRNYIPLHDGGSCKKWKLTNRKDDVNGFVPVEPKGWHKLQDIALNAFMKINARKEE